MTEHQCKRCHGLGRHGVTDCEECDDGSFEHGSHEYTCAACDGKGQIGDDDKPTVCLACDGFGEDGSWRGEEAVVGDGGFQARYLRLFAQLPNVEIAPAGRNAGAHIRFDGGRGMVMPMRAKPAGYEGGKP